MPWTSVQIQIDKDKTGAGKAEAATIIADYSEGSLSFQYTERVDSSTRSGFVARAIAALAEYQKNKTREETLEASLLTQLNG